MRKLNLLAAACALVLGASKIEAAMLQQPQMTQLNHNRLVREYVQRLKHNFKENKCRMWTETMEEARNNGVLDDVLTHQYTQGMNALAHAIACDVDFAGNPWDIWGNPAIRATLLTQNAIPNIRINVVDLALKHGYDDNTIFQLVRNARDAGVLGNVLLNYTTPGDTTFLSFITHYRSESLIRQVIQMVRDTNPAMLGQLITDHVIDKARQIESPVLPLLEQAKREIDGNI